MWVIGADHQQHAGITGSRWMYSRITMAVVICGGPHPPQQSSVCSRSPSDAGGTCSGLMALFACPTSACCSEVLVTNLMHLCGWGYSADAQALACTASPVTLGRGSSAEPNRKADAWRRRKHSSRLLNSSVQSLVLPKLSPLLECRAASATSSICSGALSAWGQLHLLHLSLTPSPLTLIPAGLWLSYQSGDGAGSYSFDGEIGVEKSSFFENMIGGGITNTL